MTDITQRYLELLKQSLINELYLETEAGVAVLAMAAYFKTPVQSDAMLATFLNIKAHELYTSFLTSKRGGGFPRVGQANDQGQQVEVQAFRNFLFGAHSMIGRARIDQLHACLDSIVADNIPGDLIETGVWKGGATIFMRGYLAIHGIAGRRVWVADSFQGLPKPLREQDAEFDFSADIYPYLSVSLDAVKALFQRYDLLDEQVCFLQGWFKDTLPTAPITELALLRLDGDLYESTMDALLALYGKVASGGYVVVDDYLAFPGCREAVDEFRATNHIDSALIKIDDVSVYWRKETP